MSFFPYLLGTSYIGATLGTNYVLPVLEGGFLLSISGECSYLGRAVCQFTTIIPTLFSA